MAEPGTGFARSSESPEALLGEADRALAAGDLDGSARRYQELLGGATATSAKYGLGVVAFAKGDWPRAASLFDEVIAAKPDHANALYYRGAVAAELGQLDAAAEWYNRAITSQPLHEAARSRRAWLWTDQRFRDLVDNGTVPYRIDGLGVYAHLLEDKSLLSTQGIVALRRMRLVASPPTITWLGMVIPLIRSAIRHPRQRSGSILGLLLLVALAWFLLTNPGAAGGLASRPGPSDVAGLLISLVVAGGFWSLLWAGTRAQSTTIIIDKGRLQIAGGLLSRRRDNLELWRVQSIELRQGWLHRLSNTGYLAITTHDGQELLVPGPARGAELERLFQELLDLVYLLRANPLIKGIIY